MSSHVTSNQPGLSEKARRLFAAHDREVAQFHRQRRGQAGG